MNKLSALLFTKVGIIEHETDKMCQHQLVEQDNADSNDDETADNFGPGGTDKMLHKTGMDMRLHESSSSRSRAVVGVWTV